MIDGEWYTSDDEPERDEYEREETVFRDWLMRDGSSGPDGQTGFRAERGRYHLYVAYNCPWAHRTLIFRKLKNLEDLVSVSYVAPRRTDQGWVFDPDSEHFRDDLYGASALHEIYARAEDNYTGRVTVPVLWDKETETVVNNESSEIIRMFNGAFADIAPPSRDYYPPELQDQIDRLNDRIYRTVNNGVYKTGFARTQEKYEDAFDALFETLNWLDDRLGQSRYLCGSEPTEADWRLFPTLARFDVAYHYAFKCNLHRLTDYPNLWPYARDLYQTDGISETCDFEIYKRGYFSPSKERNPLGIVPKGPALPDWEAPPNRA